MSKASAGISAASAKNEKEEFVNYKLNQYKDSRKESQMRITEQGQNRLAKKIILLIHLSFGSKSRSFFVLQLPLQPLKFILQGIGILAGFGSNFNCPFQLRRSRLDLFLQSSFISFKRRILRGEGLQRRNNSSKILGK